MPNDGTVTVGTNFSQFGILLDFDAPALVVAEVEVELVHVVHGQHVNVNLHRIQRDEMATRIEVHATISEVGPITDGTAEKLTLGLAHVIPALACGLAGIYGRDRQALTESLNAIKHAGCIRAYDGDLLGCDVDFVGFGLVEILGNYFQHNAIRLALAF